MFQSQDLSKERVSSVIPFIRVAISAVFAAGIAFGQAPTKPQTGPAKAQASPAKPKPPANPPAQKTAAREAEEETEIPPDVPGALFPAVVARVNGRAILGRDLEQRIQSELAPLGNPEWKNLKEDYQQDLISESLGALVAAELIYQKGASMGLKATDAEIQAEFAKTAKSFGSDADMNIALANRGLDRAGFTKELARSLTVAKYIQDTIAKKIVVTPAEVDEYYASHKTDFNHPELIRTSHILFMLQENATPEQEKLALQRAEMVLARVKKGEDFAKLAKEYSTDVTASNGGDVGLTPKGALAPEYEEAAFALPVGGVSNVIRTRLGYHIIKVTEKRKAGIAYLDEVRPSLTGFLKNQRIDAELEKVVNGLRGAARIELLVRLAKPLTFGGLTASSPRP
jgi:parvulin-like peptidyl-prolyl isomerase